MEKLFTHPTLGEIIITKSLKTRNIRLKVHPKKGISVSLPYFSTYKEGLKMVEKNMEWILKTINKQHLRAAEAENKGTKVQIPQTREEVIALAQSAKADLLPRIDRLALQHGFAEKRADGLFYYAFKQVTLKNNSSNWGSCSTRGNINLNIRLMLVPEHLRDYIILHELCHLKHHNHGPEFHKLLNSLLNGREKEYTKEIKLYQWE